MTASHLKLALRVLLRRRFFTFASLFGISFTLAVLLSTAALLDQLFGDVAPDVHVDRRLGIYGIKLKGKGASTTGFPGYAMLSPVLRDLPASPETTIFTVPSSIVAYHDGQRHELLLRRTDGAYFRVLSFRFLEGAPFGDADEAEARPVAVVGRRAADRIFGPGAAVGRSLEIDGRRLQVVGVVEDVPPIRLTAFADLWAPLSTSPSARYLHEPTGNAQALILARSRADLPMIRAEVDRRIATLPPTDPKTYDRYYGGADTLFEAVSRMLLSADVEQRRAGLLFGIIASAMVAFMVLPALNLVNLNVSRALERSSELGVRRAFGATRGALVTQLLLENVVLTLFGGVLGLAGAWAILYLLGSSGLQAFALVRMRPSVTLFLAALALTLFFGLFSGVYPAWRLSRLQPVAALRGRWS